MDEKRKVVIIAGQLVVGGAERQLYLWLANLDRTKFVPTVITLHPGHEDYWENPIEELGIPLFRVPQKRLRWMRLIEIYKIIRPFKPDLIHAWHLFSSPYAGIAAKVMSCPSLGSHRDSYNIFKKSGLLGILAMKLTDAMLVNSNTTAERLRTAYPGRSDRIYSVQNAVLDDFLDRSQARKQLTNDFNLDPQKIWIGSMGRLDPKKRFDLLLEAFSRIENESFQLILIGDGPQKGKLVDLSVELGIAKKVCFTGEIPEASRLIKAFDVFTFTSFDEGLPNVILEAGAAGIPIITWDLPFYREVVLQDRFLVTPGDVETFASTLTSLLADPQTVSEISFLTRQKIINSFNLEHYIKNMTSLYDSLLPKESPSNRSIT